jgi:hypothetical protein
MHSSSIPENPDVLLGREAAAGALTKAGYPITTATLATDACRGGGPPYRRFGKRAIYRWGDLIDWAKAKAGPLLCNSSDLAAGR